MPDTLWLLDSNEVIINSAGELLLCDHCPCEDFEDSYISRSSCCFGFPITLSKSYYVYYLNITPQRIQVSLVFNDLSYIGWWEGSIIADNGDLIFARLTYHSREVGPDIAECLVQLSVTVTRDGVPIFTDGYQCIGNAGGNPSNSCDFTDPSVYFGTLSHVPGGYIYATTRNTPFDLSDYPDNAHGVCSGI